METKAWYVSKLNWLGIGLALLGVFSDPEFIKLVGQLIPQEILSKIIAGSGALVIVLRTFFTAAKIGTNGDSK